MLRKLLLLFLCAQNTSIIALEQPLIKNKDLVLNVLNFDEPELRRRYKWSPENPIDTNVLGGGNFAKWVSDYTRRASIFQGPFHTAEKTIWGQPTKVTTIGYTDLPIYTGLSVAELEFELKKIKTFPLGSPEFTIFFWDPLDTKICEIGYLQSLPELKNATFQIASTFNALEGGMGEDLTKKRTSVTIDPKNDKKQIKILRSPQEGPDVATMYERAVQGEAAAKKAMGATLFRKYCMPPVNLLDRLGKKHGFVMSQADGFSSIDIFSLTSDILEKISLDDDMQLVAVGLHQSVVVTTGGYGEGREAGDTQPQMSIAVNSNGMVDTNKTQTINQVFAAAFDNGKQMGPNTAQPYKDQYKKIEENVPVLCKVLLDGAYEGTIRAAALTQSPTVVLTLMGGGAFRNNIEWIMTAITDTDETIIQYGMKAILVYRPDIIRPNAVRTVQGDIRFLERMYAMAAKINKQVFDEKTVNANITNYVTALYAITDKNQKNDIEKNTNDASRLARILQKDFPHPALQSEGPIIAEEPAKPVGDDKELIAALNNLTASLNSVAETLAK